MLGPTVGEWLIAVSQVWISFPISTEDLDTVSENKDHSSLLDLKVL